tara:strand:+ start:1133 stop:1396 length:264 start_codon:yes stop_codon:yes gene_type:complete
MANDGFQDVLNFNCFKNAERWNGQTPLAGGKPPWGNSKLTIQQAVTLEPGTYSVGVWQYQDSGSLSVKLTKDVRPPKLEDFDDDDFK